jgi:hypothetical protein
MLTQETVTVLLIALVVNALIVASLIVAPRLRDWSRRRSAGQPIVNGGSTGGRPRSPGSDAGQPWFLTPLTNGSSKGDRAPVEPATIFLPEMASPSSWATWLDEEAARAARYERPVTIVSSSSPDSIDWPIEWEPLPRIGSSRRSPRRSAVMPGRPTGWLASARRVSESCSSRPTRSARSTTSSESGAIATSGSPPARFP